MDKPLRGTIRSNTAPLNAKRQTPQMYQFCIGIESEAGFV